MKRIAILIALLAAAGTALSTASARDDATPRTICHRTASKTAPYSRLRVSASQLRAHLRHAADISPVPAGGCPRTILTSTSGGRAFQIALTGEADVPTGDPVATGAATVRLRRGQAQLCYRIAGTNLPPAVAAHIHRGAAGTAGAVVVPLRTPNAAGRASACTKTSRSLVAAILSAPRSYYLNVHTEEFPAGAIRGQLAGTSTAAFGFVAAVALKGTSEPNASGSAVVRLRKSGALVCYRLRVQNVTLPTAAAHIHRGAAGTNGPVVVPFSAPGANGAASGCTASTAELIDEIAANPAGFYVNVHTNEHPAGAIRAQLG